MPTTIFQYLRRYIFVHWPTMALASAVGVVVTILAVVSIVILAALPQFILLHFGDGIAAAATPSAGESGFSWNLSELTAATRGTVESLAKEYGVVESLLMLSGVYISLAIVARALLAYSECLLLKAKRDVAQQSAGDLFEHIIFLPIDFFNRRRLGDITQRLGADIRGLADTTFDAIGVATGALPLFVFYWTVLLLTNWQLTVLAIVIFGIRGGVSRWIADYLRANRLKQSQAAADIGSFFYNYLGNAYLVKAFGQELETKDQYEVGLDRQLGLIFRTGLLGQLDSAAQAILSGIATVTIGTAGVVLLLKGYLDVVTLFVYLVAAHRSLESTQRLIRFIPHLYSAMGFAPRVFEIFRERQRIAEGPRTVSAFNNAITFEGISFEYDDGQPIVKDLNLTIPKGSTVAIVGPSGAGKSTLANLLMRFYDPDQGRILIDGVDVREFTVDSYRRFFSVVPQDTFLMNASIHENITFGLPNGDVEDKELRKIARIAHVDDFVDEMPEGFDTVIGDRGVRLSGGQKQRISLARAIIRNPEILILDEATSSLDSHSERLIQDAISEFSQGRTAFIIAHRLSTVRAADIVVVMENGRIVERGTHQELMNQNSVYQRMYSAQLLDVPEPAFEQAGVTG